MKATLKQSKKLPKRQVLSISSSSRQIEILIEIIYKNIQRIHKNTQIQTQDIQKSTKDKHEYTKNTQEYTRIHKYKHRIYKNLPKSTDLNSINF